MLNNILVGIQQAMQLQNLLLVFLGTAMGICFGALPGLSASMGVAVLIPITYGMNPVTGLITLAGVYCGAVYGGSISAVLINTPGTPANAVTAFDGYVMTKRGEAKEALTESAVASFWGGLLSAFALLFLAPPLAKLSLSFGPQENALLGFFGLSIIASLASKNVLKGLLGGAIGLLLGCVGMDPGVGYPRYTFGMMNLMTGIPLVPALIGFYSISQVIHLACSTDKLSVNENAIESMRGKHTRLKDFFRHPRIYLESAIVGIFIGIIPGAGGDVASFLSYDIAKRQSKTPELYGHGCREGIAASEAGNNGVTGGALIPMLTLGIPGNAVTAVFLGGLMIQGLLPGNELFTTRANITYPFIIGFFIAQFAMLILGVTCCTLFARVVRIPNNFLAAAILILTCIGAFAINNSLNDVYIMLIFGIVGFVFRRVQIDPTPIVLGLILGPLAEKGLTQTIIINRGLLPGVMSMFTRPICLVLMAMIAVSLATPVIQAVRGRKRKGNA